MQFMLTPQSHVVAPHHLGKITNLVIFT